VKRFVLAEIRERLRVTLAVAVGTFLFMLLIAGSYQAFFALPKNGSTPGYFQALKNVRAFTAFSGSNDVDIFSPRHFLAFGFNHPMFIVLSLALAVSVGSSSIAADVESGRSELLYARPIRRAHLLAARVVVWFVAEVCVLAAASLGALTGSQLSSDMRAAGVGGLGGVVVQVASVTAFFAGVGFLASAFSRSRTVAVGITVAVATTAYLANFASLLWSPIAWLRHVTPFGYYEPIHTIDRGVAVGDALLLTGAGLLFVLAAAWRTNRRDLV